MYKIAEVIKVAEYLWKNYLPDLSDWGKTISAFCRIRYLFRVLRFLKIQDLPKNIIYVEKHGGQALRFGVGRPLRVVGGGWDPLEKHI